MRCLIQRCAEAEVWVRSGSKKRSRIGVGVVILLGVEGIDEVEDVEWLVGKVARLRIFADSAGKMNQSLLEIGGEALVVSQFTLHASTRKGNRPSFIRAAEPRKARQLYTEFIESLEATLGRTVKCGEFGAEMQVSLVNDGPVTIWLDSRARE